MIQDNSNGAFRAIMSQSALDTFSVTRHAVDSRADGATRVVHVNAKHVVIERVLRGVRMRVGVPVTAYRGLVLAVRQPTGTATLTLRHDDSDLDVTLGSGEAIDLARKARAWSHVLGQPVAIEEACVTMRPAIARRTKRPAPSRRSRFSRRRKVGAADRLGTSFVGEHEIIARD